MSDASSSSTPAPPASVDAAAPAAPAPGTLEFTLKTLTGKVLKIEIPDPVATVLTLKQAVETREGIPINQQRLIQRGRQLADTDHVSTLTTAEPIHLVLRLSCGDSCAHCSNGCMMMHDHKPMHKGLGPSLKRVVKEMRDLPAMASQLDAKLALMDMERSGVIVEFSPPPELNAPSRRLFARFVFPADYPFKAPVDFTLLNEVAHPCSAFADGVSRASRRRGTVVGSLVSTNPNRSPMHIMFKEHWSPAITVSRLLLQFDAVLRWPLDETLISKEREKSLYNHALVCSPYNDVSKLREMRLVPDESVSPVSLRRIFDALDLPLPSLETAFTDTAPSALPSGATTLLHPPQTARIRARTLQRAVLLASFFPELPNLILIELVRVCGDQTDRELVTDFVLERVLAREKRARAAIRAKRVQP